MSIQSNIDAEMIPVLTAIANLEETFLLANDRYWHGANTMVNPPDGTTDLAADNLSALAWGETQSWNDLYPSFPSLRCSVEVFQYMSPAGPGYFVMTSYADSVNLYSKKINFGPNNWFGADWNFIPLADL